MAKDPFNFDDALTDIEKQIDEFMKAGDTKELIAKMFAFETGENVYLKYDNTEYERRIGDGGLGDWRNYDVINGSEKMSLIISNETKGNPRYADMMGGGYDPGYITDIIESGDGYWWTHSKIYKERTPRPFMDIAANKVMDDYILPSIHTLFFDD